MLTCSQIVAEDGAPDGDAAQACSVGVAGAGGGGLGGGGGTFQAVAAGGAPRAIEQPLDQAEAGRVQVGAVEMAAGGLGDELVADGAGEGRVCVGRHGLVLLKRPIAGDAPAEAGEPVVGGVLGDGEPVVAGGGEAAGAHVGG